MRLGTTSCSLQRLRGVVGHAATEGTIYHSRWRSSAATTCTRLARGAARRRDGGDRRLLGGERDGASRNMSFPMAVGFVMSGGVDGEDGTACGDQVDEGQILWNNRAVSVFIFSI